MICLDSFGKLVLAFAAIPLLMIPFLTIKLFWKLNPEEGIHKDGIKNTKDWLGVGGSAWLLFAYFFVDEYLLPKSHCGQAGMITFFLLPVLWLGFGISYMVISNARRKGIIRWPEEWSRLHHVRLPALG